MEDLKVYELLGPLFDRIYGFQLSRLMYILWQLSPRKGEFDANKIRQTFEEMFKNPYFHMAVAFKGEELIGVGSLYVQPNLTHNCQSYAHIENIVVSKPYRGKGVGQAIMNKLLEIAKKYKCYKVVLSVDPENDLAVGCYRAVGFEKTGEVEMRLNP